MDDRRHRAEEIFHQISDLAGEEREQRLIQLCGEDSGLLEELRSLLRHSDAVDADFLGQPPQLITRRELPKSIGPYRPIRLLGEGGMGSVYLAEAPAPLERQVAVKVMAFGVRHEALATRFAVESRTLARLKHPNIAQVFDAGTDDDGAPYFAMEFVDGETLLQHCDHSRLSLEARIRLFLAVCAGVEHAHQRGVIHRDLKPSNLLVATHGEVAVPKIIDFGIAKELEGVELGLTRGPIGTPDYMSPEQMSGEDYVDTRSDVYSLGMMLYELLSGVLPHDPHRLRKLNLSQRYERQRTDSIPRPSDRFTTTEDPSESAHRRRTTRTGLRSALRHDLDWIVLKALEREPDRRYASAADLSEDLRRYLDHRPVKARPPDRVYLLRKAIRRNPFAWGIASTAMVVLLGFLTLLVVQNRRISRQQDQLQQEAATATRVVDFLVEMFDQSDPRIGQLDTAEEILALGRRRATELEDLPEVRARLLLTMGVVHTEMGLLADGQALLEECLSILHDEAPNPIRQAEAEEALATVFRQTGQVQQAEELQAKAVSTGVALFGPDDTRTISARANYAVILQTLGRFDEAEALLRDCYARWPRDGGNETRSSISMLNNLAVAQLEQRSFAEAESTLQRVIALRTETLGNSHLETLEARSNLAFCYSETGRLDEAIRLWEHVLEAETAELGGEHPNTLRTATNLASMYLDSGRFEESESMLSDILRNSRRTQGDAGRGTLAALNNLGRLCVRQGRWDEAIEYFQDGLRGTEVVYGPDNPYTLRARTNLAVAYRGSGRYAEAEENLLVVLRVRVRDLGADHPDALRTSSSLGLVHELQGRWADAVERHRVAYEGRSAALGADHRSTLGSLHNLIRSLIQAGRRAEALELARRGRASGLDMQRLLEDPLLATVAGDASWQALLDG